MVIRSKDNLNIKRAAALLTKKGRREQGAFLLEGIRSVTDSRALGARYTALFIEDGKEEKYKLKGANCPVYIVDSHVYKSLTDTVSPQGITAVALIPKEKGYYNFCDQCLLLDGIRDAGNLGTLIRTAAGFGYRDIFLINCADPYAPKTVRSTMSAIFAVNLHVCGYDIMPVLKEKEYDILAADMDGMNVQSYARTDRKICLCIGGEAAGLSREVIDGSDRTIAIKTESIESLNAAVSGAILMYLLCRA